MAVMRKFKLTVEFYLPTDRSAQWVFDQLNDYGSDSEIENAIQGSFDEAIEVDGGILVEEVPA